MLDQPQSNGRLLRERVVGRLKLVLIASRGLGSGGWLLCWKSRAVVCFKSLQFYRLPNLFTRLICVRIVEHRFLLFGMKGAGSRCSDWTHEDRKFKGPAIETPVLRWAYSQRYWQMQKLGEPRIYQTNLSSLIFQRLPLVNHIATEVASAEKFEWGLTKWDLSAKPIHCALG
jgi:hypothetical protein